MMFFSHPLVRAHLLRCGRVCTLRDHAIRPGRHLLVTGSRFKQRRLGYGTVRRVKRLAELTPATVRPWVKESGMRGAEDWIAAFRHYTRGTRFRGAFIFRVTLLAPATRSHG